jgi:2-hydroxy-6-oxonona-2,4-dienedioate hydrolase
MENKLPKHVTATETIVNGLRIHSLSTKTEQSGGGSPVILVQGLSMSNRYLIPALTTVSAFSNAYAPDMPGFGDSAKPPHVLGPDELSDVLAGWLSAMGIEQAILAGHSFGCQVVAAFAIRHPERIKSAVLAAPVFDPQRRSFFRQFGRLLADAPREPLSLIAIALRDYWKFGIRRQAQTLQHAFRFKMEEKLPLIEIPTIVVRGEFDSVVPHDWAEKAAEMLPGGKLITIKGGAHGVVYSLPDAFAGAIRDFRCALPPKGVCQNAPGRRA